MTAVGKPGETVAPPSWRILIVTNTYPPADITGVGALAVELARELGSQGHDVRVLTRDPPPDDPYALRTGGGKLLFPLRAALLYRRQQPPFDLVHVHESDGTLVILAIWIGRLLRRGLIYYFRKSSSGATISEAVDQMLDFRATPGLGGPRTVATLQVSYVRERRAVRPIRADGVIVSRPTRGERIFQWLRAPMHAALGRLTASLVDAVVAPSHETARELAEDYGATVAAVVPNGLADPQRGAVTRDDDMRLPGRPLILYAGRLRTRKAVAVLLVAFRQLLDETPGAGLVIAGDGDLRPMLSAQALELGLADCVWFVGAVPRAEMERWYATADIFCLPSTYEGFPVAILEAMAYGLPVVSTRVAGIPEAVVDGETGFVVEPECARSLAARLGELVRDPELRSQMGRAGRRKFERQYQVDTIVRSYTEVYAAVLRAGDDAVAVTP